MSQDMLDKFNLLDINTKRNQISDELIIMNEIITNFEIKYNIPPMSKVKNYDQNNDKNLTESEVLTFFYEDIFNIQQELITLLSAIEKL